MKPHLKPHSGAWLCIADDGVFVGPTAREAFVLWYCARIYGKAI
jgi:hypothetical protein